MPANDVETLECSPSINTGFLRTNLQ